jgi:hypothetical protein
MPTYTSGNGAFTPATNQDNWTLDSQTAGVFGKVVMISWGGSGVSSVGYRTRWVRPTTIGSSTFTSLGQSFSQPNFATVGSRVGTFATAPVLPADPINLHAQDWNVQGGTGVIVPPLANPWWFINGILTGQISCRNTKGTDASLSSYDVTVEE